jgi:Uma2 family endonuclease
MDTILEFDEEISDYELERGKPMPSYGHSKAQLRLLLQIAEFSDYISLPELNLDLQGYKAVPDIAVFGIKTLDEKSDAIWVTVPPLLTIEILSPKQALRTLFDKAKEYLARGVEEAWIVVPEIQTITVYSSKGKQQTFISGDVRHQSTGINVNIERLFS